MFWMATLNPGGKTRRKLSKWQRMVKKYGGVQGAIKARRRGKRLSRRVAKGGKRKLSAWNRMVKKYGGLKAALKVRNKLRRRHSRKFGWNAKSATKRGRRSRRRGGKVGRRNAMRRTRRSRRTRRNAWHGAPRRHRAAALKGWRKRRKGGRVRVKRHRRAGARRRRAGILMKRPGTRSFVPAFNGRRRRRKYRRNSVVPVSWNGRRRRRKYRRNGVLNTSWNGRRRRRSYRRNGVLNTSWNPGAIAGSLTRAPMEVLGKLKDFIDVKFWLETGVPAVAGYTLSQTLGSKLYAFIAGKVTVPEQVGPYARIACDAASGAALAWGVKRFLPIGNKEKIAQGIWLGTVVNVAVALWKQIVPMNVRDAMGMSGMGANDLSSKMRSAVARRVEAELSGYNVGAYLTQREARLSGMGAYLTQREISQQGVGEYITDAQLRRNGSYSATPSADLKDYDVARTETTF